jgi:dolichyl-phosphate-mannose-protein mannosyltransferase
MLPFMIFCIVYVIRHLKEINPSSNVIRFLKLLITIAIYWYFAVVLLLFLMFYPILSGAVVSRWYVDHALKWFSSWIF